MAESSPKQVTFRIQRYDPEEGGPPYFQEFTIPLSRRTSCRMGICGSCGMLINNYPHLACHTQIEEFHSNTLTVKPLPNQPIIKDLVVDLMPMFNVHKSIKPYIIRQDTEEMENPTAEFDQLPQEVNAFLQFTCCIKCGICIAACPTSASDKVFLGPQSLAQCYRYCADSRDEGQLERFPVVSTDHGVWRCHLAGACSEACSEACPKGLDPALAIQLLKRQLASQALGLRKKHRPSPVVPPSTETKPKIPFPEFTVKGSQ